MSSSDSSVGTQGTQGTPVPLTEVAEIQSNWQQLKGVVETTAGAVQALQAEIGEIKAELQKVIGAGATLEAQGAKQLAYLDTKVEVGVSTLKTALEDVTAALSHKSAE